MIRKVLIKVNLLLKYIGVFGFSRGIHVFIQTQGKRGEAAISLAGLPRPFYLRRGTSDIDVFNQVFLVEEYKWPSPESPKFIVDAGANIGLTSLYFVRKYPDATLVAIEPEESNFEVLQRNLGGYPHIECLRAGIWDKDTWLVIENTLAEKWSFTCRETEQREGSFPAFCPGTILKKYGKREIDILKIDIEGSELEVFSSNVEDWLPYTRTIMIELHDNFRKGTSRAFFSALLKYDFSFDVRGRGKTLICMNNSTRQLF